MCMTNTRRRYRPNKRRRMNQFYILAGVSLSFLILYLPPGLRDDGYDIAGDAPRPEPSSSGGGRGTRQPVDNPANSSGVHLRGQILRLVNPDLLPLPSWTAVRPGCQDGLPMTHRRRDFDFKTNQGSTIQNSGTMWATQPPSGKQIRFGSV